MTRDRAFEVVKTSRRAPRGRDLATKERLLEAGTRLFSERGFAKVTVRDVCSRARANVAAINYHFGGKAGLYEAVLQAAISVMQGVTEEARREGEGRAPEEQLEAFVAIQLRRFFEGRNGWIHRLMMHEIADPTAAFDLVIERVIRPRLHCLAGIVAALIGCPPDDERVARCVASVQAQCLSVMRHPLSPRLGYAPVTREQIPALARHITRFSVAGIREIGQN